MTSCSSVVANAVSIRRVYHDSLHACSAAISRQTALSSKLRKLSMIKAHNCPHAKLRLPAIIFADKNHERRVCFVNSSTAGAGDRP